MLSTLKTINVGPASSFDLRFAPRLNVITGDNGLGKSFLLDIAWWALTRRWPVEINGKSYAGMMARPSDPERPATIEFSLSAASKEITYISNFDRVRQAWTERPGRPANPGLVIYAQVDGGFAVWDPARNYWKKRGGEENQGQRPEAYVFTPQEIWDGLRDERKNNVSLCNGLIADWAGWQKEKGVGWELLQAALGTLSPDAQSVLAPGELTRISLNDARDIPTLKMPYQGTVPILHASAGIKRIVSLAYLLVWTWLENRQASRLLGQEPAARVIFLIDEIESHLHPRWQRTIIPSLFGVMENLAPNGAEVQIITTTHTPLVLASLEAQFSPDRDAWFDLDLVEGKVQLENRPYLPYGDAADWLVSPAFDLPGTRSIEVQKILEEAAEAMSRDDFTARQAAVIEKKLHGKISDIDPFWIRWRYVGEKKGWRP